MTNVTPPPAPTPTPEPAPVVTTSKPFLNDKVYDGLKWVAMIALPAVGTAYAGLGMLWGLPHVAETVGSIGLIDTALGSMVGVSKARYEKSGAKYNGEFVVAPSPSPDKPQNHSLVFNEDLVNLSKLNDISLKVVHVKEDVTPPAVSQ